MEISVGHTPDSDDAFMFYGMFTDKVPSPDFTVNHVIEDIENLNLNIKNLSLCEIQKEFSSREIIGSTQVPAGYFRKCRAIWCHIGLYMDTYMVPYATKWPSHY